MPITSSVVIRGDIDFASFIGVVVLNGGFVSALELTSSFGVCVLAVTVAVMMRIVAANMRRNFIKLLSNKINSPKNVNLRLTILMGTDYFFFASR
jgi:hypothetical protein